MLSKLNDKQKRIISFFFVFILIICLGFVFELYKNRKVIANKGVTELDLTKFVDENGKDAGGMLFFDDDKDCYVINIDNTYVSKIRITYKKYGEEPFKVRVIARDSATEVGTDSDILYSGEGVIDYNVQGITQSIVNINNYSNQIVLVGYESVYKTEISKIEIVNQPFINWYRLIFTWLFLGLVFFIVVGIKYVSGKVEYIFAYIALSAGILLVIVQPFTRSGWDEEIHFSRAYKFPFTSSVVVTDKMSMLFEATIFNHPNIHPESYEEYGIEYDYLNEGSDYSSDENTAEYTVSTDSLSTSSPGYLIQALAIFIGRLFHLPFAMLIMIGKFASLLTYVTVMFFAIRKIPFAKKILAVIALMPTPMFLASNYSTDPTVIAFISLFIAYFLYEYVNKDKVISKKSIIIMLASFVWGCLPKAIYAPLILVLFLLPKEKFKTDKGRRLFRIGVVVVFALLMFTFVLPTLINTNAYVDDRGGATSVSGQLLFVLKHPIFYARVLSMSIVNSLFDYTVGTSVFGLIGGYAVATQTIAITVLIVFVIITDNTIKEEHEFDKKSKIILLIFVAMSVCLIWTSLYLSFTPVGNGCINGVQGRYYLPILILAFVIIRPKNVKNKINDIMYNRIVFGVSAYILIDLIYKTFILGSCS